MSSFKAGEAITELKVTPDKFLPVRYAGASGDFNPIHTDKDYATMVGLPSTILHGLWSMAQVARAVTDNAGGPEHIKSLSVQFRGMGFPEQEITVSGTVRDVEGGVATLDIVAEQNDKAIIRNAVATVVAD
jgi:acyl dehydratase